MKLNRFLKPYDYIKYLRSFEAYRATNLKKMIEEQHPVFNLPREPIKSHLHVNQREIKVWK